MTIPNMKLTIDPIPAPFAIPEEMLSFGKVRYSKGGIGVQDTSMGLMYQLWRAELRNDGVYLSAPNTPIFKSLSVDDYLAFDFTFDQNMNPAYALTRPDDSKYVWWYNAVNGRYEAVELGSDVTDVRIILDDKRQSNIRNSDVMVFYIKDTCLMTRQQRDRFTIEYQLTGAGIKKLIQVGMAINYRLQFYVDS